MVPYPDSACKKWNPLPLKKSNRENLELRGRSNAEGPTRVAIKNRELESKRPWSGCVRWLWAWKKFSLTCSIVAGWFQMNWAVGNPGYTGISGQSSSKKKEDFTMLSNTSPPYQSEILEQREYLKNPGNLLGQTECWKPKDGYLKESLTGQNWRISKPTEKKRKKKKFFFYFSPPPRGKKKNPPPWMDGVIEIFTFSIP